MMSRPLGRSRRRSLAPLAPLALIATLALGAALGGCSASTVRTTFQMPPDNVATVRPLGARPRLSIDNRGAGLLEVAASPEPTRLVRPGETIRLSVRDDAEVRLLTGPDAGTTVTVEARHTTGATVSGPLPRPAGPDHFNR